MKISFRGQTVDFVPQDKMTPGEVDAVERATDLTFQRIRRLGETCVCGHGLAPHRHKDDAGEFTGDTACTECDCARHISDMPTRISTAYMWVSIKRADPSVKFADVANTPQDELTVVDDEPEAVDANPTDPPPGEESLTSELSTP